MARVTLERASQVGDGLPIVARLSVVGIVALAEARWPSAVVGTVLVVVMTLSPPTVLLPLVWSEKISREVYMRYFTPFLAGIAGALIGPFGQSLGPHFPTAALILGFGSACLLAGLVKLGPEPGAARALMPWLSGSVLGIYGILADDLTLAWNTITFFLFGFVGFLTLTRLQERALAEANASPAES